MGANLDKLLNAAVMTVLADGDLHGYRIVQRVARMPMFRGRRPDPTGVYRCLKAMAARQMVAAAWEVSANGPARRLYRLTPRGRRCLARWVVTLRDYHRAVGQLLTASSAAARHTASKSNGSRRC
jgi:DNA-binding PadR family transcriptional regulator